MKTYVFFFLFSLGFIAHAQPTLTKDETINYVNKKMKEAVDHVYSNNNGRIGKVSAIYTVSITKTPKGINIVFTFDDPFYTASYEFNPAHIKDVFAYENSTSSAVNELQISLIGATCAAKIRSGNQSLAYANMLYLKADPTNLQKIKKALMHLRDLYKAEDDPFAN